MSTKNVTLKEKVNGVLGDTIFPATTTPNVYDSAKSQALSQTLVNTPDYEALGFAKFSTATAYNAGDKVYKDNELYRFIADKTAGEWDVAKVEPWSVEQEIESVDDAIRSLIPAQASADNKLADKAYVNDKVSTDTATFRGTFNLVTDLELTTDATEGQIATALNAAISGEDKNDYAFVQIPTSDDTPTEIARIDRYKYTGLQWAFEYSLNNSGFTVEQLAAINSGITSSLVAAFGAKYDKPAGGIPVSDMNTSTFDNEPTENSVKPVKSGGVFPIAQKVAFVETSFGKYDTIRDITLSQGKSGKYVSVDGTETSAAGYGISNAVELNFGDILLVPSAEAVPASVSVVARVVTRAYAKVITYAYTYQQEDPTLYDTATADYDPTLVYTAVYDTSGETPVLTGWTIGGETIETLPATHEVTESYYEPLVKQAVSAMPSTGYYVYLCPSAMTVVISGYTATVDGGVCKVVGWGIFKNIVSNFIGAPGQSVLAQLLCDLDARVKGIMARLENLGEVKAITIESENLPMVCGQPLVVEGTGAPSIVPQFVGQRYHDTTNSKCYEAFAVTGATSNWKLLN